MHKIGCMSDDEQPATALDPTFFEGWLTIDILAWDWNLRIAINPAAVGRKVQFQGLDYGRDFILDGRIRAPRELRGKSIKVTLSPFGPKVRFGRGGLRSVGQLAVPPPGSESDFEGVLMLPEDAIATTAASLASTWKHLQVRILDQDVQGAEVLSYHFAAAIHPNLQAGADDD